MPHNFASRLSLCVALIGIAHASASRGAEDSALSDEAKPLQVDEVPDRVRPILEIGDTFLGAGSIKSGFTLPTGAVWQPSFILWGNYRTAVNSFDDGIVPGSERVTEWVNRLDLFGQLSLSQTERVVIGFRPFDKNGEFSGYRFNPNSDSVDASNDDVNLLYFEGNLAEIFPRFGRTGRRGLDIDFSIGRQPLQFQEATLVVDTMDAVTFTRNNITLLPRRDARGRAFQARRLPAPSALEVGTAFRGSFSGACPSEGGGDLLTCLRDFVRRAGVEGDSGTTYCMSAAGDYGLPYTATG